MNPSLASFGPPQGSGTPQPMYRRSGYDLHDDNDHDLDSGDIPLLRRDGSHSSYNLPIPGGYDEDMPTPDNRSETNIRYGRIPQRVPRRYKTIKKVE